MSVEFKVTPYCRVLDDGSLECEVCERKCRFISDGDKGLCGNRVRLQDKLYVIGYGLLSAIESRPIEIKPLYHYWPGSSALTFSNWGCNFYCPWCQNYAISFRKPNIKMDVYVAPEKLVKYALKGRDEGLCASFNEPITQTEYLIDVFSLGCKHGLYSCIVSNGYMTTRVLEDLVEAGMDAISMDIKGCPETYGSFLKADAEVVFRNAKKALDLNVHVEMVYLIVTGANDSDECIDWVISRHLDILGPDVPLHINRYYPANKYLIPPTQIKTLIKAYEKAKREGIKYVYIGNVGDYKYETTYCPKCGRPVIVRSGYEILSYKLDNQNKCLHCGEKILLRGKRIVKNRRWSLVF